MKKMIVSLSIMVALILGVIYYAANISVKDVKKAQSAAGMQEEYWPEGGWRTSAPEEQGMDSGKLAGMINSVRESGKRVSSITVIRNGYLVNETYFYPYQKGIKHFMNSCAKSFVSAFVGMAADQGRIKSIDDGVLEYFADTGISDADKRKRDLKVRNLLTMTTGLDWDFITNTSTNNMLQSQDWTRFTLSQPMKEEPGRTFLYCNGAAHLLSTMVQKTMGKSLAELAAEKFSPMGIKDIYWSSSPENVSNGYTGLYMNPEDAAKIGYLYLKKGNWNGTQLISEKWVEESTREQVKADWTPLFPAYGYLWWIPRFGGYAALGQGGDYIFVVPKLDMVVVFTGGIYNLKDLFYPAELMEKYIAPSVKSGAPLKPGPEALKSLNKALDSVQKAPLPAAASSLPEIAGKISGKPFEMDDGTTTTLWFREGNECVIEQDSTAVFTIGLDNVYRIVDSGRFFGESMLSNVHLALKGRWLDEKTLELTVRELEEDFEVQYIAQIENDRMEVKILSNIYPERVSVGKLKE